MYNGELYISYTQVLIYSHVQRQIRRLYDGLGVKLKLKNSRNEFGLLAGTSVYGKVNSGKTETKTKILNKTFSRYILMIELNGNKVNWLTIGSNYGLPFQWP
jgi:hypothetical protein